MKSVFNVEGRQKLWASANFSFFFLLASPQLIVCTSTVRFSLSASSASFPAAAAAAAAAAFFKQAQINSLHTTRAGPGRARPAPSSTQRGAGEGNRAEVRFVLLTRAATVDLHVYFCNYCEKYWSHVDFNRHDGSLLAFCSFTIIQGFISITS